ILIGKRRAVCRVVYAFQQAKRLRFHQWSPDMRVKTLIYSRFGTVKLFGRISGSLWRSMSGHRATSEHAAGRRQHRELRLTRKRASDEACQLLHSVVGSRRAVCGCAQLDRAGATYEKIPHPPGWASPETLRALR